MHMDPPPTLSSPPPSASDETSSKPESSAQDAAEVQAPASKDAAADKNFLANHKGKLAVGAAAMLGLAIFYKWRESKLAKEDPEEYARLQRLKAAVASGESDQKQGAQQKEIQSDRSTEN